MDNLSLNLDDHGKNGDKTGSTNSWIVHPFHCPDCGKGQLRSDRCIYCGTPFPSFAEKERETPSGKETKTVDMLTAESGSQRSSKSIKSLPTVSPGKPLRFRLTVFALLFAFLASATLGLILHERRSQRLYLQNYVLALYGMKSGMDLIGRVQQGTYSEWKGDEYSDVVNDGIDPRALDDLAAINKEIRDIIDGMHHRQRRYEKVHSILMELYSSFDNANSALINSHGSPALLKPQLDAATAAFSRETGILKANMPAPLASLLEKESRKYDLRFIGY